MGPEKWWVGAESGSLVSPRIALPSLSIANPDEPVTWLRMVYGVFVTSGKGPIR